MIPIPVVTIGWRAQAALARGGPLRPLSERPAAAYLMASNELIWLGRAGAGLHARAVLVPHVPDRLDGLDLDHSSAVVWRPAPLLHRPEPSALATRCRNLLRALPERAEATGFGGVLVGRAAEAAGALALACVENDPTAAVTAAKRLIGLGPGLTPAGDDFVGGAFFARAALVGDGATRSWQLASAQLRAFATAHTHPVSAVLLSDLLDGEGYEPLHNLAAALADDASAVAVRAARRLISIGHSSGWDLLAGFLAGVLGAAALSPSPSPASAVE